MVGMGATENPRLGQTFDVTVRGMLTEMGLKVSLPGGGTGVLSGDWLEGAKMVAVDDGPPPPCLYDTEDCPAGLVVKDMDGDDDGYIFYSLGDGKFVPLFGPRNRFITRSGVAVWCSDDLDGKVIDIGTVEGELV